MRTTQRRSTRRSGRDLASVGERRSRPRPRPAEASLAAESQSTARPQSQRASRCRCCCWWLHRSDTADGLAALPGGRAGTCGVGAKIADNPTQRRSHNASTPRVASRLFGLGGGSLPIFASRATGTTARYAGTRLRPSVVGWLARCLRPCTLPLWLAGCLSVSVSW